MPDPVDTNSVPTARGCASCGASNAHDARFCASCGAGLPPLTPPGAGSGSVAALMDQARQHLLLGHWEDASLAAEAVLTLNPDSAEGHHIAARSRLKQGMSGSALSHAERAVALEPANNEYQTTLAEAMSVNKGGPRMNVPAMVASVVAILVFSLIGILAMSNRGEDPTRIATPAPGPTSPSSPFAQPPGNTPFPQPERSPGVDVNRPRIPARTAPPVEAPRGATDAPARSPMALPSGGLPAVSGGGQTPAVSPLAPAPVATPPLQRFPDTTPAPQANAPRQPARPSTPPYTQPATPPGVVAAPPAQPGGTIFGPSPAGQRPSGPAPSTTPNPFVNPPANAAPAATPTPPRPVAASPQQHFVDRDYGRAIQALEQRIQSGEATGANYQNLGAAYAQMRDRARAAEAYRNAIAAYRAQIQSGPDVEVARRGLRNSEQQLRMLGGG